MYTIAIANPKGGCGKTTLAINLSACLAEKNKRTLLVDIDPQGHASTGVSKNSVSASQKTIYDTLMYPEEVNNSMPHIIQPVSEDFDLIPSSASLFNIEQQFAGELRREERLYQSLQKINGHYDYAVIDCPPGIGLLVANAFIACDELIIPVETSFFALYSVAQILEEFIQVLKPKRSRPFKMSVVATMHDKRTRLAKEVLQDIGDYFGKMLYKTIIWRNIKLQEAASLGIPITEHSRRSRGYRNHMALAAEIIAATNGFQTPNPS
jgi:chromosome partitioning protein